MATTHFVAYCHHCLHTIEHDYCERCMSKLEDGIFHCSQCSKEGHGDHRIFTVLSKEPIREKEEADDESVHEGA